LSELKVSSELSLPKEAATWVFSYLAKRGAGKTYNAAVQAEEMLKAGIPIVVIDGMGIWWGLRVSADGKGAGFPIVVFGGEHADLPLNVEQAEEIARAVVETNISCVLDLSEFSKGQAKRIVADFLNALYRLNRVDRHVFIEEADLWAPQKAFGDEAVCLGAVDNFIRRGGNHNLGSTLITQRSAVLNKNILTQSDCLVILRTLAPQDKEAIQAWVAEQTDKDKKALKEWFDSLNNLENGEAWVWKPEKPAIYQKVKYRTRQTFHATREFIKSPQAIEIKLMDVGSFISKFQSVFKIEKPTATTNTQIVADPKLKQELAEAKTQLEEATKELDDRAKQIEELEEKQEQLLSELAQLNSVKKLRDAMLEIIPVQTAIRAPVDNKQSGQNLIVEASETAIIVKETAPKIIVLSTDKQVGKLMLCATELINQGKTSVTSAEMQKQAAEHGWIIGNKAMGGVLLTMLREGYILKDGNSYRLPSKINIEVTNP
jgi:hypothetical protein